MSNHATPRPSPVIFIPPTSDGSSSNHGPVIPSTDGARAPWRPTWKDAPQLHDNNSIYTNTPFNFFPPTATVLAPSDIVGGHNLPPQAPGLRQIRDGYSMGHPHPQQISGMGFSEQHTNFHPPLSPQRLDSAPSQGNGPSPNGLFTAIPFTLPMYPRMSSDTLRSDDPPRAPGSQQTRGDYSIDYTGYPWGPPRPVYPQSQPPPLNNQYQHQPQQSVPPEPFRGAAWSGYAPGHSTMADPWPQMQQKFCLPFAQFQPQQPQAMGPFSGMNLWSGFFFGYIMMGNPWMQMQHLQPPVAQMVPQQPPGYSTMQGPRHPSENISTHEGDRSNPFLHGEQSGVPSRYTSWSAHPQAEQPRPHFHHPQHQPQPTRPPPPGQPTTGNPFAQTQQSQRLSLPNAFVMNQRQIGPPPQAPASSTVRAMAHEDDPINSSASGKNSGMYPRSTQQSVYPQSPSQGLRLQQPQPAGPFHSGAWTTPALGHLPTPDHGGFRWDRTARQLTPTTPRARASRGISENSPTHGVDQVGPFMRGEHYGPVLEPLLVHAVGAKLKINPLLQPVPDDTDRPHLMWNMLFPSNDCQRSTDASHISWMEGRHEPATFPRVTALQIVSKGFPWTFKIGAAQPEIGVTCGDLIDGLSRSLNMVCAIGDYNALPPVKKHIVKEAYQRNRSRTYGVPGGALDEAVKQLDFLGDTHTFFGGILNDEDYLNRIAEVVLPCTVGLMCIPRKAKPVEWVPE